MNNIDFRPSIVSGGKLSVAEARHRQQICTTAALADLEASPEFKLWKRQQEARGPFSTLKSLWQDTPQVIIASFMLIIVIFLIGTSISLRHQAAHGHVSNATNNNLLASTPSPSAAQPLVKKMSSPSSSMSPLPQQQQSLESKINPEEASMQHKIHQLTNLVDTLQSDLKAQRGAFAAAKARASTAEGQVALLKAKNEQLKAALEKASSSSSPVSSISSSSSSSSSLIVFLAGIACSIAIILTLLVMKLKQTRYDQSQAKLLAAVPGQIKAELDRTRGQLATAKLELTAARRALQQQQHQLVVKAHVDKIVEKSNSNNNNEIGDQWRQAALSVWNAVMSSSSSVSDTIPAVKATRSPHRQDVNTNNNDDDARVESPAVWVDAILNRYQSLTEAIATATAERTNAIDRAAAAQAECERFQSAAAAFEKKIQQEADNYDAIISNLQEKLHITEADVISLKDTLAASQQRCAVLDAQAQKVGAALANADEQRQGLEERVVGLEQELSSLTALAESLSSDKKALLSTIAADNGENDGPTYITTINNNTITSTTTGGGATLADYFSRRLDSVASMLSGGGGSGREGRVSAAENAMTATLPLLDHRVVGTTTSDDDDDGTWLERANQLFESAESLLGAELASPLSESKSLAESSSSSAAAMLLDQEERLLSALQTSSEQVGELLAALHTAQQLDCRSSSDIDRNAALVRAENQLRVAHDKVAGAVSDLKAAGQGVVQSKGGVKQLAQVLTDKSQAVLACEKMVKQANLAKTAAERDIDASNATLADIQTQLQNPFAEEAQLRQLRDAALTALDAAVEAKRVAVAELAAAHQAMKTAEEAYDNAARELSLAETKAAEVAAVKNGAAEGLQLAQKRLLTALEAATVALQNKVE